MSVVSAGLKQEFCYPRSPSQAPNIGLGTPQWFIFLSSLRALINVSGVDVAVMV